MVWFAGYKNGNWIITDSCSDASAWEDAHDMDVREFDSKQAAVAWVFCCAAAAIRSKNN